MNGFINKHLGVILLTSAAAGLLVELPPFDISPVIVAALAAVIFASFFSVELNRDLIAADLRHSLLYFVLRFTIMPVVVYYLVAPLSPFYAAAFLLLFLLPAAVSSPAFTAMFGGKISLSLKLLVLTSFLSIVTIPVIARAVLVKSVDIDGSSMLLTMVYTIVAPFVVHLPLRRSVRFKALINSNSPLITAAGLAVIFIVSTSRNRNIIFANPEKMLIYAIVAVAVYSALYLVGFYMMSRQEHSKKIAYSIASGANNIGLGVTLTALFFSGDTNVFFIISQIAWIFILIPVKRLYRRR